MPLDKFMYSNDYYDRAVWYLKFAWLPRRCEVSNKLIWLTRAYKGTVMWTGPGDPIIEHKWISKQEFLFSRMRGKL